MSTQFIDPFSSQPAFVNQKPFGIAYKGETVDTGKLTQTVRPIPFPEKN